MVSGDPGVARRCGVWPHGIQARVDRKCEARVEPWLLSDGVVAWLAGAAARRVAEAGRRHRDRCELGLVGRWEGWYRAHAFFGESRQRGGIQRVWPAPYARD